ncbi:lytic transglycosylase domain-containing protein [Novosphingobium jiangmenense]|uniref:Lytic transglycosylase domain-containing protein n=1 Tax=Novosphingobium jiangmenense TaxID=2791981 RepID=A0ABS0HGT1_9SPHN|nr:lytic transglycosylase domain-containing protein [Novosphingobium jiangmenense]MBF9151421.1 lytic transglycosylase domain-containing protein [Novosphingobium jiangmenense]
MDGDRNDLKLARAKKFTLLTLATSSLGLSAVPAHANSAAVDYFRGRADRTAVPSLLSADDRSYYKSLFSAIEREDWTQVQTLFAQRADGPLHTVARAQYMLAATSPKAELAPITDVLAKAPDLPWAEQLGRLALKRGATEIPALPQAQRLVTLPNVSKRIKPRSIDDGTMPATVAAAIQDRIKFDDPVGARVLLDGVDATLSPDARAEWRQKVGWAFYIENDDATARALSLTAAEGTGPWVSEAYWTAGLASWRLSDCLAAADSFEKTAGSAQNDELASAAHYWASRAWLRCRKPEKVSLSLRNAARFRETLYGMMAAEALGMRESAPPVAPDFSQNDWQQLRDVPNIRTAVQLAEIGEDGLADEILRHQARIGAPGQYAPLSRLARDLGLPSTQLWMAYNAPAGARPDEAARFPAPKWTPATGWKVDPALLFAHSLQESNFRTAVTSPAGAKGLMQVRPGTAKDMARVDPLMAGRDRQLDLPDVNLAFGQQYLQQLRDSEATQGLLPKVMAAYNAGPLPISRWNTEIRGGNDPLLWMESIPYWETRGYVSIVMRNYWMYEKQAGGPSESRMGLVQGMWPKFPGLSGAENVRIASRGN